MSEWWTYGLSDFLLFSPRTYYRLFQLHNSAVWPAQLLTLAAGAAIFWMLWRAPPWRHRAVPALLAACWLWVAWSFLAGSYATINWAAPWLAVAYAIEAAILLTAAVLPARTPSPAGGWAAKVGIGLVAFAVLVQPLTGPLAGRAWSRVELFGIAPDPTVVATLGAALCLSRLRRLLLPIPVAASAISGATLWAMGSPDALVLPAAASLTVAAALARPEPRRPEPSAR